MLPFKNKYLVIFMLILLVNQLNSQKKNVLVFIVDDLGYHDLSSKGSKLYETPHIDTFSKEGIDFNNAYVSHPRCLPSRFALQTSKYPGANHIPGREDLVGEVMSKTQTIGQAFQDAGYETFFAGKWHLGHTEKDWPQNRGYDINIAGCSAGAPRSYFYPYNKGTWVEDNGLHKDKKKLKGKEIVGLDKGVKGEYLTDRLTDETIKFLKKGHPKPFFAILNHYGVHTPLEAPKELVSKYQKKLKNMHFSEPEYIIKDGESKQRQDNAVYAAMIESVDDSFGKIIDALKELGLYENTIIVFSSDHGGLSNRGVGNKRVLATTNLPLRAGKGHMYEGGIKVPLFMGGAISNNTHYCEQVTSNIDLMPTLLDLCRLGKPKNKIDGLSIASNITNGKTFDRTLFWHAPRARKQSTGDVYSTVIRVGDFKLIDFYKENKVELYNVVKDPYEKNNIASGNKELTRDLLAQINNWKKEVNATE